jgi:MerR family copper efflux transcriptional regulator
MNIGEAARVSGVSAKMIRHYEDIGLIPKAGRTTSGYRVYSDTDLYVLSFIRQSRNLGFSIDRIRDLLGLWQNKRRTSQKVKELALNHLQELDERILELQEIRQAIAHLADHCHGDDRPDCPILDGLAANRGHILNGTKNVVKGRHMIEKKQGYRRKGNPF